MEKINRDILLNYLYKLHSDAKCALNYNSDYELLIAIILSAQTTDVAVNKVTPLLFSKYKNIEELSKANINEVEDIIKAIGLYKNKAKSIANACLKLYNDGYDYVPNNIEYLMKLDGVGRKTANVFLAEYYNEKTLGVDTHIYRICKRLNLIKDNDSVIDAEKALIKLLKDYDNYKLFHHMMIYFGRYECKAKNPLCETCELKEYCREHK